MDQLLPWRHLLSHSKVPLLAPRVVAVAREHGFMDYVPPSSGGAPPCSTPATSRCNRHKAVWWENLKLFPWHLKASEAKPIEWISLLECNLPFDSTSRSLVLNKERLECSTTLEHYIKIGSVKELPPKTTDGL